MPYLIRKEHDNFIVINKGNGQRLAEHQTYKAAVKDIRKRQDHERKQEWSQWFK